MERLQKKLRLLGPLLLALGVTVPATAQDTPKAEISIGYQVLGFSGEIDETFTKGWYVDVAGNVTPLFGIVFELGGNYKSVSEAVTVLGVTSTFTGDLDVHEFMAGIRLNARPNPTVTPFGQILVGGVRGSANISGSVTAGGQTLFAASDALSGTDFALQIGGGINLRISDGVGIRAGADYIRIFAEDEGIGGFRFGVGAVFPF